MIRPTLPSHREPTELFTGTGPGATARIVACTTAELNGAWRHLHRRGFAAQPGEVSVVADSEHDTIVAGVGDGPETLSGRDWRDVIGAAVRACDGHAEIVIDVLPDISARPELAPIVASAVIVATRQPRWDRYPHTVWLNISAAGWDSAVRRGTSMGQGVNLARSLVDSPSSDLGPLAFAEVCADRLFERPYVEVEVIARDEFEEHGLVGLSAVGAGSHHGPCLLEIRYQPPQAQSAISLVGKGVTYDSGGISLKSARHLEDMKTDMGGAAAVIGSVDAITSLNIPTSVYAVIPLVENMPGPAAYRPGDLVRYPNGVVVEITNTDAEGRLVLADGLLRTQQHDSDIVLDVATLTYGCVAALGLEVGGLFSTDDDLADLILGAAETSGDLAWRLPIEDRYRRHNRADYGEIVNLPNYEYARATTAALFLSRFVSESQRWAHIDMYGPSSVSERTGEWEPGATGYATRLIVTAVEALNSAG